VALLVLSGCGSPGTALLAPPRQTNWWSFYEKGREALRTGDLAEASAHFERCLGLRSGVRFHHPVDGWRVRTYGMHFVDNYFPNRELGITLLLDGRPAAAIPFLEASLRQEPSERARHYLQRALAGQAAAQRPAAPRLDLTPSPAVVPQREGSVQGLASAAAGLVSLQVGGQEIAFADAPRSAPFAVNVPLQPGLNTIPIRVRDLLGQETQTELALRQDRLPPRWLARHPERRAEGGWRVTLVCQDAAGLTAVRWGERDLLPLREGQPTRAEWTLDWRPGAAPLEATDAAGNRSRFAWDAEAIAAQAAGESLALTAQAAGGPAPAVREAEDRKAPVVRVNGVATTMAVHDSIFYVDGTAADAGGLVSLTINGEEQIAAVDRGGAHLRFATEIALAPGTNRVVVAARDTAGNRGEFAFQVAYFQPEYEAYELRLRATVPPFRPDPRQAAQAEQGDLLAAVLGSHLLRREEPRFRLLERNGAEWAAVLREQELSLTDLVDERARLRLGRLTPADLLFVGHTFDDHGGRTFLVRVVETVDGRILFSEDVYSEQPEEELDRRLAALASKLERRFPLLSGEVIEVEGEAITLNLGRLNGVNPGVRFLIIGPEGEPQWGEVRRHEGVPLEARPSRIKEKQTRAKLSLPAADRVKEGDRVYAR
jgi:hypothetical protein